MKLPLITRSDKKFAYDIFKNFKIEDMMTYEYLGYSVDQIFNIMTNTNYKSTYPNLWILEDDINILSVTTNEMDYYLGHSGYKRLSPLSLRLLLADRTDIELDLDSSDFMDAIDDMMKKIIPIIYNRFSFKWRKLYLALTTDYNPLENYSMIQERTADLTDKVTYNSKSEFDTNDKSTVDSIGSVYGYNSSINNPSTKNEGNQTNVLDQETNRTGDDTTTHTGTDTLTRAGNIGVTTSQQMLESEFEVRKKDLAEIIYNDIDSILCSMSY